MARHCHISIVATLWLATFGAQAETVEEFYRGKQVKMIIRAAPGGNYDLYLRAIGRHMGKHMPGTPTFVPVNMPGAGGLTALHYFDKVAPHDGTTITIATATVAMDQALGTDPNLKTDIGKLRWLGNVSDENLFLVTKHDSSVRTMADARIRSSQIAGTGAGGLEETLMVIMNSIVKSRFKPVVGYQSGPAMTLALERGEVDGRFTTNLRSLFSSSAMGADMYNVLLQIGIRKDPAAPNAPMLVDFAEDDRQKEALELVSKVIGLSRPVATNERTPEERVVALRQAFQATLRDPEFLQEAKRLELDVNPWTGDEVDRGIRSILDAPTSTKDLIRSALKSALP